MMDRLVSEYPSLLIPAVFAFCVATAARALYALHGSFSQRRKEFIECWERNRSHDDLWLEMVVRHVFGKYIPADIIRMVISKPGGARALQEVSSAWKFVKYDAGTIRWSRRWMNSKKKRKLSMWLLNSAYFASAFSAALMFLVAVAGNPSPTTWVLLLTLLLLAFFVLDVSVDFGTASKVIPKHLGIE